MKLFFAISMLFVMTATLTLPLFLQGESESVCESKKSGEDDSNDEFKLGKEKEVYSLNGRVALLFLNLNLNETKEKQYYKHDNLISENHAQQLEMPPDA
jgi:hypothetical protein